MVTTTTVGSNGTEIVTSDMFIVWTEQEVKKHQVDLIKALRSGYYRQGDGRLLTVRNANLGNPTSWEAFCCLGVACDMSGLGEWAPMIQHSGNKMRNYRITNPATGKTENYPTLMPKLVAEYYGWPSEVENPQLPHEDSNYPAEQSAGMANLNDDYGWNFKQFADALELEWGL